ncbi:DUF3876 domain-containing protein [Prevotella sp. 10(H)]|uniref:DUF3876 domain-containing protein n=1 Tax=Prevotella sp. 10(H) TaxID=1158294 RepID=UPI0004A77B90|nr:DUF3876 domain-containing protein [Prevotella sp. 10(H)]
MNYRFNKAELENMAFLLQTLCKGILNLYATEDRRHDMIDDLDTMCGEWESITSNTRFVIYRENDIYKLLFIKKRGLFRRLTMETYTIHQDSGWPYFNTGTIFIEPQHLVYHPEPDTIMLHSNETYKRIAHHKNVETEIIKEDGAHNTPTE